jgi:flagellar hook-associated protein 1 FlgK
VHATTTFTTRLQAAHQTLTQQRADLNQTVTGIAEQINSIASEIGGLNLQIKQVELNGDMANDLRDRRDLLLDDLSGLANIRYSEDDTGSMTVYLGSHELVFGTAARAINVIDDTSNPGMVKLQFAMDGDDVEVSSGKLKGVLDARDVAFPELIGKLNSFASGLINSVNTIHAQGYGLNNVTGLAFFSGTDASTIAVNSAIMGSPQSIATSTGANQPGNPSNALAIANLQQATNMLAGFGASNLVVNETLSAGNVASGIALAGSLQPGAYTIVANGANLDLMHGSTVVGTATLAAINPPGGTIAFMNGTNTVASIAISAAAPYSAAAQQADLTAAGNNSFQVETSPSVYYSNIVSVLGADVNRANGLEDASGLLVDHLESLRQSISGVNIDEEVTNLNASQHAYNAAARVISTIDEMLDTLINRTGVG